MFNIGGGEIAIILLAALILLGPKRLPELARGLGKFLREFRRQTDDVRTMVEREFYQMDQELQRIDEPTPKPVPANVEKPATIAPPLPAEVAEPLATSDPSGVPGELYDAEYHAAEANGALPPAAEVPQDATLNPPPHDFAMAPPRESGATAPQDLPAPTTAAPAGPGQASDHPPQESTLRGK